MRTAEIAARLNGLLEGDPELEIRKASSLEDASIGDIAFLTKRTGPDTSASCLLVRPDYTNSSSRTVIRVADPRVAFAQVLSWLHPQRQPEPGIHPTSVVDPTAEIGDHCHIGPHCYVGPQARLGRGCVLRANVTLYERVTLGDRVIVHAGAVIGADGFGFVIANGQYEKFPQVGTVEIGDDVEIGANCTIDRAALGVTRIGRGTKLDNLVHIAHNCQIGEHVVIAAQTGLAGGVTIGDWAVIGGQVGMGDKVRVESRAVIGSGAGILSSKIVHAGTPMWGTPARPLREYLEQLANLTYVGELRRQVKEIRSHLRLD